MLDVSSLLTFIENAGKTLNRDYRKVAEAHGLHIDAVRGDNLLTFPVEHARFRTHKYSIIVCASLIAAYGWILRNRVVMSLLEMGRERI